MHRRIPSVIALLILTFVGLVPLITLLIYPFIEGGGIHPGVITNWSSLRLLARSMVLSAVVSLLSGATGTALALLMARTDLPARRLLSGIFTIPLLVPPYVNAIAWDRALRVAGFSGIPSGFTGTALVLAFSFFPLVMLLTMAHSMAIGTRLEEAALINAPWSRVIRRITLPLMKPSILTGMALVFLLSMGEIGVPTYLRYPVYPMEILSRFAAFYDFKGATLDSIPIILIALLLMSHLRKSIDDAPAGTGENAMTIPVDGIRRAILEGLLVAGALLTLLPYMALLKSMDFQTLHGALQVVGDGLSRSVILAGIGATLITASGFVMGYAMARNLPLSRWILAIAILLFAMPGAVMGTALIALWNRPITWWIYSSPIIVLIGYMARYSILGAGAAAAGISTVPHSLEEAATIYAPGTLRIMRRILLPLTGRFLVAGWFLSFIFCFRDFDTTFLVQPAG